MALDFWAGYASGALGIIVGSPLDLMKVQEQAGLSPTWSTISQGSSSLHRTVSLTRGAAAPILGYGALNGLLFVTYHRSLAVLCSSDAPADQLPLPGTPLGTIWLAGATGGLASFTVSCPTEVLKVRAQLHSASTSRDGTGQKGAVSAPKMTALATKVLRTEGVRGLYAAGGVTAARDAVGYGFYFWAYEGCKRLALQAKSQIGGGEGGGLSDGVTIMLCGGVAGVVTWASIFPLDAVKTRMQGMVPAASGQGKVVARPSAVHVARTMVRDGGLRVLFAGLGVCSVRAFLVNAVQWSAYEALVQAWRDFV